MKLPTKPFYHFSIDDTFDTLIETVDKKIPLKKHPYFKYLYGLHQKYGITFSLYLFYQRKIDGRLRTLNEIRNIKKQITDKKGNAWLKFGPHSFDFDTAPHSQTPDEQKKSFNKIYKEIDRFAGKKARAKFVRLHYYSESYELAEYFKRKGVAVLFSTDRKVGSYRLGKRNGKKLNDTGIAQYNNIAFWRTHHRIEFFREAGLKKEDIKRRFGATLKKYGFLIFYTHEYDLVKRGSQKILNQSLEILQEMKVPPLKNI